MNVEIGTVVAQSLFWKSLFRIFGIGFFAVQDVKTPAQIVKNEAIFVAVFLQIYCRGHGGFQQEIV
jgi:hypothetical protein